MSIRMIDWIGRGPALPAAAALLAVACTCAGKPGNNPAPVAAEDAASAPAAPKITAVELPPRAAPDDAGPAAAPAVDAKMTAAPADGGGAKTVAELPPAQDPVRLKHREHSGACDKFVESLGAAGAKKDLLNTPDGKRLASEAQTLAQFLACRAIEIDDASRCNLIAVPDAQADCKERFDRFRELKNGGGGKGWIFTETELQICKTLPMAPACDAFRDVAKSGDLARCPKGDYEAFCRALFSLDRSQCRGSGPHAKAVEKMCQERIEEKRKTQDGLRATAESGTLTDQLYARAARGDKDACADFALKLSEACTKDLDATDRPVLPKSGGK